MLAGVEVLVALGMSLAGTSYMIFVARDPRGTRQALVLSAAMFAGAALLVHLRPIVARPLELRLGHRNL